MNGPLIKIMVHMKWQQNTDENMHCDNFTLSKFFVRTVANPYR